MQGITFERYTTGTSGMLFRSEQYRPRLDLAEDTRVFDKKRYNKEVHAPVELFSTKNCLNGELPRCLDMPIRLKHQRHYSLPKEWGTLQPLIKKIVSIEEANNPNWSDYYTYITVDSSWVEEGKPQRRSGLHVDGFQGARVVDKTKVTRNYVATSNGGTIFYPQLFNADFDDSKYDIFKGFDAQAQTPLVAPENAVLFMDAYTVHESGYASRSGWRTFLRVTFDWKKFDRLGNTHNSMLDYDWDMAERNVQDTLVPPPL